VPPLTFSICGDSRLSLGISNETTELFAYIDEAGCSESKFGAGSSKFQIMGAVAFRASREAEIMSL
jgi:hypothetical protein